MSCGYNKGIDFIGKAIHIKSRAGICAKLEMKLDIAVFMARNNSVYGFRVCILYKHYYVYMQINLNGFINNVLSL